MSASDPIEPVGEATRELARATAMEAERLAPELGADAAEVRAHLGRLDTRYAAALTPRAVVRHALLCRDPLPPAGVRTRVTPGVEVLLGDHEDLAALSAAGLNELDVIARDHPSRFAAVAGVVALHGGSIEAAVGFTRDDGLAVDTFRVRAPDGAGGSWWARVEGDLAEAASWRLAVRARVAAARPARGEQPPPEEVVVELTDDDALDATAVLVRTPDRHAVLYDLASAFAELGLELLMAQVATVDREVADRFVVRDADGGPLDDDLARELVVALRHAVAG